TVVRADNELAALREEASDLREEWDIRLDSISRKEARERKPKSRDRRSDFDAQGGTARVDEPEPESAALRESRPGAEASVDKQQRWRLAAAKSGTRRLRRVAGLGDDDNNAES